jgi:hypothetical protein
MDKLDLGDYVIIEQKRFGVPNEFYIYKVVGPLESNCYVDVPVKTPAKETLHDELVPVVRCICCGISETKVLKFAEKDIKKHKKEL